MLPVCLCRSLWDYAKWRENIILNSMYELKILQDEVYYRTKRFYCISHIFKSLQIFLDYIFVSCNVFKKKITMYLAKN